MKASCLVLVPVLALVGCKNRSYNTNVADNGGGGAAGLSDSQMRGLSKSIAKLVPIDPAKSSHDPSGRRTLDHNEVPQLGDKVDLDTRNQVQGDGGCWLRANAMCMATLAEGIPMQKIYIISKPGRGAVGGWNFHVANYHDGKVFDAGWQIHGMNPEEWHCKFDSVSGTTVDPSCKSKSVRKTNPRNGMPMWELPSSYLFVTSCAGIVNMQNEAQDIGAYEAWLVQDICKAGKGFDTDGDGSLTKSMATWASDGEVKTPGFYRLPDSESSAERRCSGNLIRNKKRLAEPVAEPEQPAQPAGDNPCAQITNFRECWDAVDVGICKEWRNSPGRCLPL